MFKILFRYEGGRVVERMVMEVRGKIMEMCHLPKNAEKMLRIYAKEVAGIVEGWGERGFLEGEVGGALDDMMYLTETMRGRLGPIRE